MEVEASRQNSTNLLESWRHHLSLGCHDECALPALDLATAAGDATQVPRCPVSNLEELLKRPLKATSRNGACANRKALLPTASLPLSSPSSPKQSHALPTQHHQTHQPVVSKFTFTFSEDRIQPISIEAQRSFSLCRGIKRRRCLLDVDGFNTAGMSSKKRRLRFELITSRLSQPYSQPATHILNREGQESGDKRFLKMATTLDSARRTTYLHATSFLRFSTMNRLRKRLNLTQPGAVVRRDDQEAVAVVSKANRAAAWRPQSLQASSAGRSLAVSPLPNGGVGIVPTWSLPSMPPQVVITKPPSGLFAVTAAAHAHVKPPACRLSSPAALPLPVADVAATKKRTSPRIHPVQSPELRPASSQVPLDDLEEDSFAFLHPPDDDWDDMGDGQEDSVYSDFSVLFGQEAPGPEANDERTYEEYLDELDGICWVSR